MSATLEDLLMQAADKGLTHLSLWPVPSQDGKKVYWRAQATPSTGHSYITTTSKLPHDAMAAVLLALPKAPKRKVTAAVTGSPEPQREMEIGRMEDVVGDPPEEDWVVR